MKSILVLCLPGIGDSLMATPFIKALRKKYPKATIDVLCMFRSVEYVFKNNNHIDNVYFVSIFSDKRILAIYHLMPFMLKRYDASFLTFPEYRKEYNLVQTLIFAKKRFAHRFRKGYNSELNFLNTDLVDVDEDSHNVINNLNLLSLVGEDWKKLIKPPLTYDLTLDKNDIIFGKDYFAQIGWDAKSCIAIHPGSIDSKAGLYKRWSTTNFAQVCKLLIQKHHKKIIIFCGPSERDLGAKIERKVNDPQNCHLVENMSFGKSLGILKNISLLLSNDNGFAHLSNALKVSSIVLFGPTNPIWCSPIDKRYSIYIRKAEFVPWFRNDMKVDNPPLGVKSGMNEITVDHVMTAIEKGMKNEK